MRGARRALRAVARPVPVLCLLLSVLVFLQSPGRTSFDTKLDLVVDPAGFLARALRLWSPDVGFGGLQNQAYGYLFPQGPFFAAGQLLRADPWITQAGWASALVVVAFLGALRLARALGIGTEASRLVAAAAYALAPRMLTVLGPISSEAGPVALAPWCVLPLVAAMHGRLTIRRGAALSGLAVLAMGGVNATATLAVLLLPALYLLTRSGPLRWRLAAWWVPAVSLACLWWALPLVLLGRYSLPFLDYVESAADTTGAASTLQAVRGTNDWIASVLESAGPFWPAGWTLLDNPALVIATGAVAALGLAGLARRDLPERRFLALAAVLGVVLLALGHTGPLTGPAAGWWQGLLDGMLAPLRNVHKLDPVVRLPLALGLAHLLASVRVPSRRALAVTVAAALVGITAAPLMLQQLRPGPNWSAIPGWWDEASDWLGDRAGGDRTLLVPGSGFGRYQWGRTVDEPLQPLARSPWATRSQVPLASEGASRLMDAVDSVLASGVGSPALADLLARSGVRFLLVRNDLDWTVAGTPRPAVVHQALDRSPGLERVASFGSVTGGGLRDPIAVHGFDLDSGYPALEVYDVRRAVAAVVAVEADGVAVVSGGPESVLPLLEAGVLAPDAPTVLAGEPTGPVGNRTLVTDGLRRVERTPGRLYGATGPVLSPDEEPRLRRRVRDLLPFPADGHETVARYLGVRGVSASSSASDPDSLGPSRPQFQPWAALDGDPGTFWRSGGLGGPVGQWLRVALPAGTTVDRVDVRMVQSVLVGPRVTRVAVSTESGTVEHTLAPGEGPQVLTTAPGETRWIRLTVLGVDGDAEVGGAGVRDLSVPGVTPGRTLAVPADVPAGAAAPAAYALSAVAPRPACLRVLLGVRCDPTLAEEPEEAGGMDRTFTVPDSAGFSLTGEVVPRATGALQRLLDPLFGGMRAEASSILAGDAAVAGRAAVDGDPRTSWVADLFDPDPTLSLRWTGARRLDRLGLVSADHPVASRPLRLRLVSPAGVRQVDVPESGIVRFPALTTDRVAVHVERARRLRSVGPADRVVTTVPAGIAELRFPALERVTFKPLPDAPSGLPCGLGPPVEVDGVRLPTRVSGRIRDVLESRPLRLTPCGRGGVTVRLAAGEHRIRVLPVAEFAATRLALVRTGLPRSGAPVSVRPISVVRWGSSVRTVDVAAGARSLLVVRENANAGWRAVLDGRPLVATRVDGWQQAWEVPAGAGGRVELVFTPEAPYRRGLFVGALAAAALVALALTPGAGAAAHRRLGGGHRPVPWTALPPPPASGAGSSGSPGSPGSARHGAGAGRPSRAAVSYGPVALAAGLLVVFGGWAAVAALALTAGLARRRPAALPVLAAGSAGAAVAAAVAGRVSGRGQEWAQAAPAQALCLLALAAVVAALLPVAGSRRGRPERLASVAPPAAVGPEPAEAAEPEAAEPVQPVEAGGAAAGPGQGGDRTAPTRVPE